VNGNADAEVAPTGWGLSSNLPQDIRVHQLQMDIDVIAGTVMTGFHGDAEAVRHLRYDATNIAYSVRPKPRTRREESRRAVPIGPAWPPAHLRSGVVWSLPAAPLSVPPGLCSSRPIWQLVRAAASAWSRFVAHSAGVWSSPGGRPVRRVR
jgi:hypothetical protein